MVAVGSWGRLGTWQHHLQPLNQHPCRSLPRADANPGLAYGMGRSYGDVCLNPGGTLWPTQGLDRLLAWDPEHGILTCEAGLLLRDIQQLLVPRGWMLPVTPGTQLVTVGGAIANDVHGKNHHRYGSFGDHVLQLDLLRSDGQLLRCSPQQQAGWLAATLGGLGLTGVITQATLRLRRVPGPWLHTERLAYRGLEEFFALADASEADWEHTVAWLDCRSGPQPRGIFMRANHSGEAAASQPAQHQPRQAFRLAFTPPFSLVNRLSLRPFNALYHRRQQSQSGLRAMHYEPFFYPLDQLPEWNRLYGPKGFYQYQCVLPRAVGLAALQAILAQIQRAKEGSFLAVLKTFGERSAPGMLSFARPGVTLALDFPNRGAATERLLARLDAVVREAQGSLYPAKDARMPRDLFASGYPRLAEFLPFRDPGISSALARRLIDPPF